VNAFCVTVFCIDEAFESRSKDFLTTCFALYPDREYMIITLPHTTSEFALLHSFNQVEARPASSFGHLLYLFHRDALLGALSVRTANIADEAALTALTGTLPTKAYMDAHIAAAIGPLDPNAEEAPREVTAFVAEVASQVVGFALLRSSVDIGLLQSQYMLEDFILFGEHRPEQHVELLAFVLNPVFGPSSRFVLKEAFRLMTASCLYYRLTPETPIPEVLSQLVQVKPRSLIAIPEALEAELIADDPEALMPPATPPAEGALFFLTRKLISEPKIINNTRVVVVGGSDAAIALLEALISVPYLHFTNLYFLAPHALDKLTTPRGAAAPSSAPPFLAATSEYTATELAALHLGARVRLIDGRLVDLDRRRKAVVLPDDSIVPYDYLVLAPEPGDQSMRNLGPDAPGTRGVFSLCDDDADAAAEAFLSAGLAPSAPLVVYGGSLDAYTTVHALIARGIAPARITLALPPPPEAGPSEPFGDPRIAEKVQQHLVALGGRVRRGARLVGLESDDEGALSAVIVEEVGVASALPARVLLCAGLPEIDRATFRAINDNSLVYDGGLVIDDAFRTNDPAVYAAGAVTKFARRYKSKIPMGLCSARECGSKLAQALLPVLDPLSPAAADGKTLPTFTQPTTLSATLPGGLHFLSVALVKAGCASYEAMVAHPSFGRELVSDAGGVEQFCSVRLDQQGIVTSLVYLGREPVEAHNWKCMIRLPEAALNHLASRFDEGVVPDLPAFFRQNWAMALYHDRFGEFRSALRQEFDEDADFKRVMASVRESADYKAGKPLATADFVAALPEAKRALVKARLVEYLQNNQNQLSMYLVPSSAIMKKMDNAPPPIVKA